MFGCRLALLIGLYTERMEATVQGWVASVLAQDVAVGGGGRSFVAASSHASGFARSQACLSMQTCPCVSDGVAET